MSHNSAGFSRLHSAPDSQGQAQNHTHGRERILDRSTSATADANAQYLIPPAYPVSAPLLSSPSTPQPQSSSSPSPQRRLGARISRRHLRAASPSSSAAARQQNNQANVAQQGQIRPQRSFVMRQRLRRFQYDDDDDNQPPPMPQPVTQQDPAHGSLDQRQGQPESRQLPLLPGQPITGIAAAAGGGAPVSNLNRSATSGVLPRRRHASYRRVLQESSQDNKSNNSSTTVNTNSTSQQKVRMSRPSRPFTRTNSSQPNSEELATSGLLHSSADDYGDTGHEQQESLEDDETDDFSQEQPFLQPQDYPCSETPLSARVAAGVGSGYSHQEPRRGRFRDRLGIDDQDLDQAEAIELHPTRHMRMGLHTIDLEDDFDPLNPAQPGSKDEYDEHAMQVHRPLRPSETDQLAQGPGLQRYRHSQHRHPRLSKMLHGNRPDRELFPYRTRAENWWAFKTFVRRFFLVFLIIPGWIIPNVLLAMAKAAQEHDEEEKEDGGGSEGGAHGPSLSKGVNLAVFLLNMFAMMHLGKAAGACLEELVPKLGASIVSIFDAMTSSSVELAVAAFALIKGMVRVVQAAMLGAILNNLLLMMGIAFVVGGMSFREQTIQSDTSQTGMNLLMIVCISYVVPIALDKTFTDFRVQELPDHLKQSERVQQMKEIRELVDDDIWTISKIMAPIMLILYGCCLLFQYQSRSFMVTPEAKHQGSHTVHKRNVHYWVAGFGYTVMLTAQIYSASLLVHSVEELGRQFKLNESFVGFILLPIVLIADLQEEVIAIKESKQNRLDRCIALMIGSCMQIALLVTPLLVLLGWIIDIRMTFRFTLMEAVILAGSVLMVNYLLQDNETNWLEGGMMLALFVMCAIAFYFDTTGLEPEGKGGGGEGKGGGGGGH
ncbi:hypothetical protein BGW38_009843 [Lunasporangiospora selenospora]|uniref:Sodium/calcium exchanger membrane region domain-containing protein n=1 Tax=Lunasporangiospora selenospora TaxID=979761 RepID=A0A9P6FXN0_9FUNG|nr:hypothetical protein BGW38_009843 [Lunasporangiospora selenospora]